MIPFEMAELPINKLPEKAIGYFADPVGTQGRVLAEILQAAKDTRLGKKYNFAELKTREEFVKSVPLSTWGDYAPYSEFMENGQEDILFPGRAEYFIKTSGTTGKNKFIPESPAGAAGKRAITSLRNALQISAIMKARPELAAKLGDGKHFSEFGKILTFSSSGNTGVTKGGIPVGFASGITSGRVDAELQKMYCCPPEILNVSEQSAVDYLIMRFALMCGDIMAVAGNNAGRFKVLLEYGRKNARQLISHIEEGIISEDITIPQELRRKCLELLPPSPERARELKEILDSGQENFVPKNYWKNLSMCSFWLGGSVGVYVEEIRPLLPAGALYFDVGYGASELKINVPMTPGTPYGALGTFVGFFEFLPQEGGEPVFIDGLRDGGIYEIVITTYSGLYRYKMGDYIQVSGKTGATPNIMFISKTGDTASLANEKVSGEMIVRAARQAVVELNCGDFVFCQVYPSPKDKSYHCYIEIDGEGADMEKLAKGLDATLMEIAEAYGRRRHDGSINPPIIHLMKTGWQRSLYDGKLKPGVSQSQVKLPVVVGCEVCLENGDA